MIWLIYSLISALSGGINKIFHRMIMLKEDTLSYSFIFQMIGCVFFIPLMIMDFTFPDNLFPWVIVLFACIVWALETFVAFEAYIHVPVSVRSPLDEVRVIFLLILSVIFLAESLSIEKVLGTILVFIGIFTLTYQKGNFLNKIREKGIMLVFLSAFLYSIASILDKAALKYFSAGTYGFLVYFVPAIMFIPFITNKKAEIGNLFKNSIFLVLVSAFVSFLAYFFRLKAFSLADVSLVFPITRLSVLIGVISGIIFLKERENILRKIIASIIVIIGVVLISGYFVF